MQLLFVAIVFICCVSGSCASTIGPITDSSLSDEFQGPFSDWVNVVTAFGAVGDGTADDTLALQKGLNATFLNTILWIPKGTYRITSALIMTSNSWSQVIGEDPETTIIQYDGPTCNNSNSIECSMLYTNGISHFKFSRLTWDGGNRINSAIWHRWDGVINSYSGRGHHSDEIFRNARFGMRVGNQTTCGSNCATAEWLVIRCRFENITVAAWSIEDWNALDWFIRHCIFINCNIGVTNSNNGAGNFHVYESAFFYSTTADVLIGNCLFYSIRQCFSYGSALFFKATYSGCHPQVSVQANVVVASQPGPMLTLNDRGPLVMYDNTFISVAGDSGPALEFSGPTGIMLISVGNTWTVTNQTNVFRYVGTPETIIIDDVFIANSAAAWTVPTLPGFQLNVNRPTFIATPNNQSALQEVIQAALQQTGNRPVLYFPSGNYPINESIVLPPNCDIQFLGKETAWTGTGTASYITWVGKYRAPMFLVEGPSKVSFRGLTLNGNYLSDGIVITNADQMGARIYAEELDPGSSEYNLYAERLDNCNIDLIPFYHAAYSIPANRSSVEVTGGPCSEQGMGSGRVAVFGGASTGTTGTNLYHIDNGARLVVEDIWYEGNQNIFMDWQNNTGTFTFTNSLISPYEKPPISQPTVSISGFKGKATFLSPQINWEVSVTNQNPETNVALINTAWTAQNMSFFSTDGTGNNTCSLLAFVVNEYNLPSVGRNDSAWLLAMFEQVRGTLRSPAGPADYSPSGVTDVRLYRVHVENVFIGLNVQGNLNQTICATSPASHPVSLLLHLLPSGWFDALMFYMP